MHGKGLPRIVANVAGSPFAPRHHGELASGVVTICHGLHEPHGDYGYLCYDCEDCIAFAGFRAATISADAPVLWAMIGYDSSFARTLALPALHRCTERMLTAAVRRP
jgi:hypothetical protein